MRTGAIFSDCRKWRYTLWREFDADLITGCADDLNQGYVQFIGLNPSTADETQDDPTIRRCMGFAKAWGYSAMCMTNLFAWRETDSTLLKTIPNPVGQDNQHHLLNIASKAAIVIAAWGTKGSLHFQDLTVKKKMNYIDIKLHCLRVTKDGHPEHPLYLPKTLRPIRLP